MPDTLPYQPDLRRGDGAVVDDTVAASVGRTTEPIRVSRTPGSEPERAAGGGAPPTIIRRLVILVVVIVLLMSVSTIPTIERHYREAQAATSAQLAANARLLARAVTLEFERETAILQVLSTSPYLVNDDWQNLYDELKMVVAHRPEQYILLFKAPGTFLFHTGVAFGAQLPGSPSAASTVREVFATGRPEMSNLLTGSVLAKHIFGMFIPIVRDGQVAFVMVFASVPHAIYTILEDQNSPAAWLSLVFDRNGIVVARDELFDESLGKPVSPVLLAASRSSDEGFADYRNFEGVATHAAFAKLPESGWTVATGIPLAELNAPWVNAVWTGGISLAVAAFLAIVFAIFYGRLITRPVLELSALAAALGRGERVPVQHLNLKEAQATADQMYIAGAALEQRAREIGALNAALGERANALEVANQELEGLSYSTSHVLRAPLRAIDGFSQILLEEHSTTLDSEGKRLIGVLRSSARALNEQVEGILEFLRLNRDKMSQGNIEMAQAVQLALKKLEPATRGRRLTIEVSPLPSAFGDAAMIGAIWMNLLDNAIKFTAPRDDARIDVGALSNEAETIFYVRDNGVGFDMQFAGKLFGVFNRLHGYDFPGNGTGLAIVQRVVSRHGGRVWAEGKPDEGATFYFTLPASGAGHG